MLKIVQFQKQNFMRKKRNEMIDNLVEIRLPIYI